MLDKLRTGSLAALVLNRNYVEYVAATQCEFLAVGLPFSISDNVFGLGRSMPNALMEDFNRWAVIGGGGRQGGM